MPRKAIHPWDIWFNGKEYKLQRGIDFKPSCRDFRNMIYHTLNQKGLNGKFSVAILDENTILLTPNSQSTAVTLHQRSDRAEIIGEIVEADKLPDSVRTKSSLNKVFINTPKLEECYKWICDLAEAANNPSGKILKKFNKEVLIKDSSGKTVTDYVLDETDDTWYHKSRTKRVTVEEEIDIRESFELVYPNDFSCHPKKAINLILDAARNKGLDVSNWRFEERKLNSFQGRLNIFVGTLSQKIIDKEREKLVAVSISDVLPVTSEKMREWLKKLRDGKRITLYRGKDYSCSDMKMVSTLYKYATEADIRLYEGVLTAEKGVITVQIGTLDQTTKFGVQYDEQYVNKGYYTYRKNLVLIDGLSEKLALAQSNNASIKLINRLKEKIEKLEQENKGYDSEKPFYQPEDLKQQEIEEQKIIEAREEKEDEYEVEEQPKQIEQQSQPVPLLPLEKLRADLQKAKDKNNTVAIKFFREKLKKDFGIDEQ